MKNIRNLILITFMIAFVFGCKKDDDNYPVVASTPQSDFTAKINGTPYIASSTYCMLIVDSFLQFRAFGIQGYRQSEMLSMMFLDTVLTEVVDSATTSGGFGLSIQYEDSLSTNYYNMVSASLDFSKFDTITKKTSGTFSGILVGTNPADTLHVTDGKFTNVTYEWSHSN